MFDHIPFPGYEIYAQLPWRRQMIQGLLGADLLGFQRRDDASNFLRACRRLTALPHEGRRASTEPAGRASSGSALSPYRSTPRPRHARPAGRPRPAPGSCGPASAIPTSCCSAWTASITPRASSTGSGPTANCSTRVVRPPETVLVQVASPSRERVEQYQRLRDEVEGIVGRINGQHGQVGTPAVHYLHQSFPREEMAALYLAADVMLVTPLRDGMNLVAKEYVACRHDERGALVLSEFTGAADELRSAFLINPQDIEGRSKRFGRRSSRVPRAPAAACGRCAGGSSRTTLRTGRRRSSASSTARATRAARRRRRRRGPLLTAPPRTTGDGRRSAPGATELHEHSLT